MKKAFLYFGFLASPVYAQFPEPWQQIAPDRCVKTVNGVEVATIQGLECLFANVVRVLTPIAGLALFIMLVVGAFQFMTSGGDPKQVQKASHTLTYAIAGIVLFFGIWLILKLIQTITGVDVSVFNIPGPQ